MVVLLEYLYSRYDPNLLVHKCHVGHNHVGHKDKANGVKGMTDCILGDGHSFHDGGSEHVGQYDKWVLGEITYDGYPP